ncbi:MAG: LysR family transcriptional regulator [Rhizobiales bacterium]|nr:LysR family transcriptional regulator [Hyphomicrobiales bacterium]
MDWDKLRIFHAAAEAGSFTHAGDLLQMSQSAVSRQVGALERDLNVSLFHRHARGLVLTEQGELLYRTAHDVFNKLQSAETLLADSKDKPTGELRVTTTTGIGSAWLTPRLDEFLELYPDIQLKLILADQELDISMREADCGIWLREPQQNDLIRRPLFTVHLHCYASVSYIRRHGAPTGADDLDRHRIIGFGGDHPVSVQVFNWLQTVGLPAGAAPRRCAMEINNVYGLMHAVRQGIGLAVLPDYLVANDSDLVAVLETEELLDFQTYFVFSEEMRHSKRVNVFRDFLIAKARQWRF